MDAPTSAGRQVVATFDRYIDAQRAVDYLSDQRFPVERVAIVAEGLRMVEQVTGRLSYPRVALSGATSGGMVGLLFGALLGLLNLTNPETTGGILLVAGYGLLFGALIGAALGIVGYMMTGGRRDFSSVGGMDADRYLVMVEPEFAGEAASLLRSMPPAP